jgi:two-component system sensor histidine kinase KdpD
MSAENRILRLIAVLIALAALTLITAIAKNVPGFNAITVALLYLLVVLATSALVDIACGIAIAVVSGLLINYYFLPPFGTFYIAAPDDWVSFGAYISTALVVSQFAAAVRRRAVEADHLQAQLTRLSQFTNALMSTRKEDLTSKLLTEELRRAYELSYCAIYRFGKTNQASPVSSGTRPSQLAQKAGMPSHLPHTLLDVVTEEGPDVQCLSLKDQGRTIGALVISQASLSREVSEAIAEVVSLLIRQTL